MVLDTFTLARADRRRLYSESTPGPGATPIGIPSPSSARSSSASENRTTRGARYRAADLAAGGRTQPAGRLTVSTGQQAARPRAGRAADSGWPARPSRTTRRRADEYTATGKRPATSLRSWNPGLPRPRQAGRRRRHPPGMSPTQVRVQCRRPQSGRSSRCAAQPGCSPGLIRNA
jgi:hypothetical protein